MKLTIVFFENFFFSQMHKFYQNTQISVKTSSLRVKTTQIIGMVCESS